MGCAGSGSTGAGQAPSPEAPASVDQYGRETNVRVAPDRSVVSAVVPATAADVWNALLKVYQEIGIPVTEQDPARHSLANPRFVVRRTFMGQRLSRFVSCGVDMMGPVADRAVVQLNIRSTVVSEADGKVRVDVLLGAIETTVEGTSTNGGPCHTTQRLEHDILNRVQLQVLQGGHAPDGGADPLR